MTLSPASHKVCRAYVHCMPEGAGAFPGEWGPASGPPCVLAHSSCGPGRLLLPVAMATPVATPCASPTPPAFPVCAPPPPGGASEPRALLSSQGPLS